MLVARRMKAPPSKAQASRKRSREEKGGAGQSSSRPAPSNSSKEWKKLKLKAKDILTLVNNGFLREKVVDGWNVATGDAYQMEKNPNEILMFSHFIEPGLALPASEFFRGLLHYYGIEQVHMNPNGIFHTTIFVHFCKAFVGIKVHCVIFRKFFRLKPHPAADDLRVVGGAGVQMREDVVG
jgi:hypothetical protein